MRLVYALQFRVAASPIPSGASLPDLLRAEVAAWIAEWYQQRRGLDVSLPATAQAATPLPLHTIEVEHGSLAASITTHSAVTWRYPAEADDRLLWESRCEWATLSDDAEFSFLLRLSSREFLVAPPSFEIRRPKIVRTIVQKYHCYSGGHELSVSPRQVRVATLDTLLDALQSTSRRLPIILFSVDPFTDQTVADAVEVADRLVGLAHVYVLEDKWAAFALTDRLGKPLSCFNGAVRTYWPGFDMTSDPFDHPIILPARIAVQGAGRLADYLLRRLAAISTLRFAYGAITRDAVAVVQNAHRAEGEVLRTQAKESGDYAKLLKLADDELADLTTRNKILDQRATELEEELATAKANVQALLTVHEPETLTHAATVASLDNEIGSARDAVDRAASRFSDTLIFLKSAYVSAEDSPYGQPDKVFQALEAMDEVCKVWRDSIRAKTSMGLLEQAFEARGFGYKAKESMTSTGKWGEEYTTLYEGARVSIEPHLTLGKGGPDTCLRIHFLKDERASRFVIAHVGRHKTNTKS